MIGLYGDWGVGKTSLMLQIKKQLDPSKSRAIWFDPWQHQFDDSPALALLHTVVDTIGQQRSQFMKEGKKLLTVIAGAFGSMLLKTTTGVKLEEIDKLGQRYEEERFQVREAQVRLRKHFEELIEKAQGEGEFRYRLVFFIDDLDRCMPAQTLSLLEALKLFLNLKGCVYFLGVDREALERSIRYHYKEVEISHTSYLDKIVQLPFTIPPIASKSMDQFIGPLLSQELQECKELLTQGLGDNPRQVKRFINLLTLNDRLARLQNIPEYDPKILAAVLLIQLLDPGLYRIIARQPDLLRKLKSETEETKPLREKHLAGKEQLKEVLGLVQIPEGADLKEYIYLARFAPVAPEAVKTGEKPLDLDALLANHKKWLETSGKEGSQANLREANLRAADLRGADLRGADLRGANLRAADLLAAALRGADLRGADLSGADLSEANLSGAYLSEANLSEANLSEANLSEADLLAADLSGADLSEANLSEANLNGARNLTEKQLASAVTDDTTILPDGSKGPFHPGSGAHQPKTESATKEPS